MYINNALCRQATFNLIHGEADNKHIYSGVKPLHFISFPSSLSLSLLFL